MVKEDLVKVEKSKQLRSKRLHKIELIILKFIPFVVAFCYFLDMVLSYFDIDAVILSYFGGISFVTLLFLYISSYVFKFCFYHRLPLHYVLTGNILNIYDYYIGIPLNDKHLFILYLIIAWIFYILILIDYVDADKRYTKSDN